MAHPARHEGGGALVESVEVSLCARAPAASIPRLLSFGDCDVHQNLITEGMECRCFKALALPSLA